MGYVWDRGFRKNQLCGCGEPFRSCSFWNAVFDREHGEQRLRNVVERATALESSVARIRHTPLLAFPYLMPRSYEASFREYVEIWDSVYQSVFAVSGKEVILESSKRPLYGWLASHIPSVNLKVVHLVRDSRGVAYSWQRKKRRPEIHDREAYMRQQEPVGVAVRWNARNLAAHAFNARGVPYRRVYYEELAARPAKVLNELRAFVNGSVDADNRVPEDKVNFTVPRSHMISGNPIRFDGERVHVRPDMTWRREMKTADKWKVSLLTGPLLAGYGYDLWDS